MAKLSSIAYYVTDKISSNDISLAEYVTTDCILQNKKGREVATNLPPQPCSLVRYQRGDVLIANIRPYLKKVWFADIDGGASPDVLVFRAKDGHSPSFLYAILLQDSFFDYVMQGTKGSKMPRGDKEQILRYEMPTFSCSEESIGTFFLNLDRKIHLNERINQNLEAMAKQLYDYWFVQFDFPDENGKPYKSSGGKMIWNEKLKREIPENWKVKSIFEELDVQYGYPFSTELFTETETSIPVVRIRDIVANTVSAYTTENTDSKYLLNKGDLVIGMDGNFHINYWSDDISYLNQRSVRLRALNDSNVSIIQARLDIEPYIKAKEARAKGSTVGHLSDKDMKELYVMVPSKYGARNEFDALLYQIILNRNEIISLTKQRNHLLPLLMNGQVSVNSDLAIFLVGFYFKYFSNFEHTISKSSFSFLIILILLSNLKSLYEITTTLIPC